jgi:hypothetical protein
MKTINVPHQPVTLERIERGLVVCAYLMERHGLDLAPIFERLEREAEVMRSNQDTASRAKQLLASYRVAGGVKVPGLIEVDGANIPCAPSLVGKAA